KVSRLTYEILTEQPGVRPAPYLASRGMSWVQNYDEPGLPDEDLRAYLTESHRLVALGLTRKKRREIGFDPD
ncbi:MAG: MmcQ/YjbR family DNA-binding protein, partial [Rhodospirillales bacterium]